MSEGLTTGVDDLVEYVKKKKRVELSVVIKDLNITEITLNAWVDFLVEEKILKLEYNLTTPILIYLGSEQEKTNKFKSVEKLKKEFMAGLDKKLSSKRKEEKWQEYAIDLVYKLKDYFYKEAHLRNLNEVTDYSWQVFITRFVK